MRNFIFALLLISFLLAGCIGPAAEPITPLAHASDQRLDLSAAFESYPIISGIFSEMYFVISSVSSFEHSFEENEASRIDSFESDELLIQSIFSEEDTSLEQNFVIKNISTSPVSKNISFVLHSPFTKIVVDGNVFTVNKDTMLVLHGQKFRPEQQIINATYIMPYYVYTESEIGFFRDSEEFVGTYGWQDFVDLNTEIETRVFLREGETVVETSLELSLGPGEELRTGN